MIKHILFVTGFSGAGMSTALDALEDLGYEVLDNFPVSMIAPLLDDPNPKSAALAIGIDTRTRGFDPEAVLKAREAVKAKLLFLQADDSVLQKRFTETRRKHPLAMDRTVSDGIQKEHSILYPLRDSADIFVDTSDFSIHDLRRTITGHCKLDETGSLSLTVMSFGYKFGMPRDADMVFDVRFLRNPHWEESLKPLTGLDQDVQNYIKKDKALAGFQDDLKKLLEPLLPRYKAEGKSYLTIAIGCSGGRHRSVYLADYFGNWLKELGYDPAVTHRDLDR